MDIPQICVGGWGLVEMTMKESGFAYQYLSLHGNIRKEGLESANGT